jgi:flagellar biosynthesis/type III secretory pathway protein FliH
VQGENWLGVALAALMKIPKERVAWLGAEALRRIQQAPLTEQQRFLLGDCVQAYLPLDETQYREFERLLVTEPYRGVQAMNTTWFEKGVEKGIEKGIEKGFDKGRRELLRELLQERFGALPQSVEDRLQQLPPERLTSLSKAILRAQSLKELGLEN